MRAKTRAVAAEAARLLYYGFYKEYKDAKTSAATRLGTKILPSNYDVALGLDCLAQEIEGEERAGLLLRLRKEALLLMKHLEAFRPRLIGSVWRGTARRGSDIDLAVTAYDIHDVLDRLGERFHIVKSEWTSKTTDGGTARFFHAFVCLEGGDEAEISVKSPDDAGERRIDGVYGDEITGLGAKELENVLKSNPLQRFVPEKRKVRRAEK